MSSALSSKKTLEQTVERFWETIPPLWSMVRAHIRGVATEKFGITVEQFHVLRYVRRGTGSVSELATAKNISRPAISQAVDVLVNKDLLTRTQSKQDRRFVDLALTPAGDELLDTVYKETRDWMKSHMTEFSVSELDNVMQAMDSLKKMLE